MTPQVIGVEELMGDVSPRPFRVLVVDDLKDGADSLAFLLGAWGFDTHVAYDGASALEVARATAPDCVITDIGLPGLDGYRLGAAIRADAALAHTKLVAVSAYSDAEHIQRVEEVGFDHRLTKPADLGQIREILDMMERIHRLSERNEELVRRNVELATEAKNLLHEVKQDIREVKQEVKELKDEFRSLKDGGSHG